MEVVTVDFQKDAASWGVNYENCDLRNVQGKVGRRHQQTTQAFDDWGEIKL